MWSGLGGQNANPCWLSRAARDCSGVRNFVAMKIGSILEVEGQPTEFWDADQGSQYRTEVRSRLNEEKLPNLAD